MKPKNRPNQPKKVSVITSHVRRDQIVNSEKNRRHQDSRVTIVAPDWVKQGSKLLAKQLPKNCVVEVYDHYGKQSVQPISGQLSLKLLQQMARNDSFNTNGEIDLTRYGKAIKPSVVYALKDLVRQCVIVGSDKTTHYGGYPKNNPRIPQKELVYVCDLSGLQFQNPHNTGRLVIVGKNLPMGSLDDFIYEKVVGEPKPTFKDAVSDRTTRFVSVNKNFFDTEAYIKFVANDVLTAGLALDKCANEELNFKFLKYGTGYFGGRYRDLLEELIPEGVARGLELLLPRQSRIKAIELPFYSKSKRIEKVCKRHDIEVRFGSNDALKRTHSRYVTATTNCADPHAGTGNRMGFGSIDSAIAENLEGKGIKFLPSINHSISEEFLD